VSGGKRILVTGIGAVTPLGVTLEQSWRACRAGEGAIRKHTMTPGESGPPPFEANLALVPEDPTPKLEETLARKIGASLDPVALYALAAATEAIAASGLDRAALANAGVVFGHGIGGVHTQEAGYQRFFGKQSARMHPLSVPKIMVSAPASAIAIEYGAHGPTFAVASACASSGHALAQAAMLIQAGLADVVITGGSEAIASPGSIVAWDGLRAMSPTTCRPFSAGRDGMAIGEGAASLVLESAEHATRRGATALAEFAGFGMSSDATHWTQPDLAGAMAAMRSACAQAGVLDTRNLLISTHGTGTPLNDKNEAQAIRELFGDRAHSHPVIATKSSHGHLIGASSAAQAALAICALRDRVAPPVLNYLGPDPDCDVDLVLGQARPISCEAALVNSFAFGGLNASVVFRAIAA
jgi:nodulation protein E